MWPPALDGGVWYTAQAAGELGWLDPAHRRDPRRSRSGAGSAPHGVIVGPDGAPWITDGGLNAIVRVDPADARGPALPAAASGAAANLNTADVRQARHALVHRPERHLRPARTRRAAASRSGRRAARRRPVRHHHHAGRATSTTPRWPAATSRGSTSETGEATGRSTRRPRGQGARRVWSDSRADLGQRVERRPGRPVRPGRRGPGASGSCPAQRRRPTPSTSTTATSSG